jgi:hypothetical protein
VEKIGLLPFVKGRHPTNVRQTLNCNLCRLAFDPESVAIGAESALTRYAYQALKSRFRDRLIPMEEVRKVYASLSVDREKDTPLSLARRVGQTLGANLMILGTVWRYRERVGGPAGSMHPASVAFDLYLVDVRTGELLWMGNFDETQRSLSENILDAGVFFRRGGRWLSANELARFGIREILKELPL